MANKTPLVTVIMTTYNHEKYVGEATESVLNQTFDDIELVIVNDGSSDNTEKVIKEFTDERIVYIYQENQGPSVAANNAILASRGKYIAIMSGDDLSHPRRIERQLSEYQKQNNKRVLFSHCNFIDDDNNSLNGGHFAKEFFNCANKNRFEILNHYFWKGNYLNDITTFTEKETFLDVGLYNPLFLQLQDFDLWMRTLLKGYEFYIMPEKLISYRIRANNANLSAPSAESVIRTTFEKGLILRNYLQINSQDDLLHIFPEIIKFNNKTEPGLIPFYIAQLALSVPKPCHQLFGIETLFNLLNNPVFAVRLKEAVGFGHSEFCEITGQQDIFHLFHNWHSKLYINTGNDYSEKEVVSQRINVTANNFSLTFDLSKYSNIQSLRWDPMENYWCKVTVEDMYYLDKSGNKHDIDMHLLTSNGVNNSNGTILFNTFDPNIFVPVQSDVRYFSITGKWETISFVKVEQSFKEKYELANELTTELKNIYGSRGWKALTFCYKLKERILPVNSKRWKIVTYWLNVLLHKRGQARRIYCHCDNPLHDGLAFSGDVSVNGWAVALEGIDRVEIYRNDTFMGNATYGLSRPDVQKRYPSISNSEMSGFHFSATGINIGKHTLTIKMVSSKGSTKTIKRKIVIKAHHTSQEEVSYAHSLTSFLTYTLRAASVWYRQKRRLPAMSELPTLVRKAVYKWRNERYLNSSLGYTIPKRLDTYTAWLAVNSWNEKKQQRLLYRLSKITAPPLLSVVMPVYNTPRAILEITIKSVVDQVYGNWELCIADDASPHEDVRNHLKEWANRDKRISVRFRETNGNISLSTNTAASLANGDYLVFLDHDDELSPDALGEIALKIDESPDADIIYSDDDKIDVNGNRFAPQFKPDWSPELLLSYMYFSHILVVRRSLFDELGGMRVGFEGSQDYDFALRASEKARGIYHIPLVLYHWRVLPNSTASSGNAKPGSIEAGRKAVQDALDRRKIPAKAYQPGWAQKAQAGIFCHKYVLAHCPSVTVIIPTKNQMKILSRCIDSLISKTDYPNYEILVIDNNSDDPETILYLKELLCKPKIKVVTIGNLQGKFNYSFINNMAVEKAVSDYVLFLNNDTEVLKDDWLTQMVGCTQIHGVGAVGARLLYPDRRIQHAGVIIKFYRGLAGHAFNGIPDWNEGYLAYAKVLRNYTAVTAACLLTPRKLFLEMGGLDENNFGVAYNDVDYCYRLIEKGYRVVYTPEAELIHHEGFSRGFCDDIKENVNFRKKYYKSKDRFYNVSLSLENERFEIQPRCAFSGEMRKRLKVLLCTHNLNHEGAPYHLYEVAIGLKQKGIIEPIVFSYTDGPLRGLYEAQGIKVIVSAQLNNDFQTTTYKNRVSEFASFVEESGVDLVYGNTLLNFYVVAAARESGIPSLWNIHESEPWQHYVNWWGNELACEALRCFEYPYKVIFVAHATKSVYSAFNSKHNFTVIHSGLNLQRVHADADKTNRNALRNELGVADDEVMVVLPGTVCERKGQHDLALALRKVNANCLRKGKYFIVGDRPSAYSKKLHDIVDSLPVETKLFINIVPETAEIYKYYKAADIFVCTSRVESFPRVILEAMTFDLPIITTPVFGIAEQVQEGVNAIFYNPGDVEVLAKSLEKLIMDNELRRRLSGNSALVLQQLNSFEDMIDSYSKIIQEAYLSYPDKKYYTIFKRGKVSNKSIVKKVSFLTTYIDENSQRYRVYNLIEELIQAGIECVVFKEDCRDNLEYVLDSDLLVAFRVGSSKNVMRIRNEFKKKRIPVVFDIDDLVFEPESAHLLDAVARMGEERRNKYIEDMQRLKETLLASDYVTCTTVSLSKRVEMLNKKCFIFPNTINNQQYDFTKTIVRENRPSTNEKIKIGYFSGTKTHEKDFAEASDALCEVLKKYTNVEFHLVGLLDLDEKFSPFRDRIIRKPLMDYLDMLGYLSQMDINLAPLELNNIFTDSKSELKIFEAALVSVPTIASSTNTYKTCIKDGVNGFLAVSKSDWFEKLETLIQDKILRGKIAEEAKKDFIQRFYIKNRINDIIDIYNRIIIDFPKGVDRV